MKISSKMLHIPPYISTSWKNVASLQTEASGSLFTLTVFLHNGSKVEIPHVTKELIDLIFTAHVRYTEEETKPQGIPFNISIPIPKMEDGSLANPLQHNPDQAHLPLLPEDVLKKIAMTAKAFGIDQTMSFPPAEPGCQCLYCQIMHAFNKDKEPIQEITEPVTEEDLSFRTWDIEDLGNDLYKVSNPLDPTEIYQVFLGTPIGCTCGQNTCEHIKAVLNT